MTNDELRKLADKATPGPWKLRVIGCSIGCCDDLHEVLARYPEDSELDRGIATVYGGNAVWLRGGETEANAAYIAAVDPQTILSLLDRCDRLEQALRRIAEPAPIAPVARRELARAALNPKEPDRD